MRYGKFSSFSFNTLLKSVLLVTSWKSQLCSFNAQQISSLKIYIVDENWLMLKRFHYSKHSYSCWKCQPASTSHSEFVCPYNLCMKIRNGTFLLHFKMPFGFLRFSIWKSCVVFVSWKTFTKEIRQKCCCFISCSILVWYDIYLSFASPDCILKNI